MGRRNRDNDRDWTDAPGESEGDADATLSGGLSGEPGFHDFGGPPPGESASEAEPEMFPEESEPATEAEPTAATAPIEGESEVERLKRELAEKDRLLRELADRGVQGEERASQLITPRAYEVRGRAMKRHPRGTILRPEQFPPGVLERMKREGRVRAVFNLPAGYAFPTDHDARPAELPRAEDKPAPTAPKAE